VSSARIQRDVKANGVRLRVTEQGSGPSLLLLHGLFMDHSTWDAVVDALASRYRVVAPDLPGFGQSEKPPESRFPYGINTFSDAVLDLYAGLELGRAALVGHALGGAVAITLAARHPELISRLVLVDALCYPARPDLAHRVALAPLIGGFAFKQLWGKSTFKAYFKESYLSRDARIPSARLDHYYESFNTPAARASALATLRATRDTRAVVAHIARISMPTLVLWGRDDTLYPAALGQRMSREIRDAGFQLLGAGHVPHEEQPGEVAEAIDRYCQSPRPR
jgi:pimeloyl-ACP methyl ester carboxylesterase